MAEDRAELDPLDQPLTRRDLLRLLHELGDAFKKHELPRDELHGTAYDTAADQLGQVWSQRSAPEKLPFPKGESYREGDRIARPPERR